MWWWLYVVVEAVHGGDGVDLLSLFARPQGLAVRTVTSRSDGYILYRLECDVSITPLQTSVTRDVTLNS